MKRSKKNSVPIAIFGRSFQEIVDDLTRREEEERKKFDKLGPEEYLRQLDEDNAEIQKTIDELTKMGGFIQIQIDPSVD
jgi:hypothetical protein